MSKVEELEKLKGKIKALEVEIQAYETQLEAIVVNDKDDAATKQEKEEEKTRLSNLIIVRCGNLDRLYDEKKLLLLLEGAMAANQVAGAYTGGRVCFVFHFSLFYLSLSCCCSKGGHGRSSCSVNCIIVFPDNRWTELQGCSVHQLRTSLNLRRDKRMWGSVNGRDYSELKGEDVFEVLKADATEGIYIKVGYATPSSSPSATKDFLTEKVQLEDVRLDLFRERQIPCLFRDNAIGATVSWLKEDYSDVYVGMIVAPPGSGKTRTPAAAAAEMQFEVLRYKMDPTFTTYVRSLGQVQSVAEIISKHEQILGRGREFYLLLFAELFNQWCLDWIREAEKLYQRSRRCVLLHLDEIQVLLPISPPQADSSAVRDFVLASLAEALRRNIVDNSSMRWLRVIMTGTNVFSPLWVAVGSFVRLRPIALNGRFSVSWIKEILLPLQCPGLVESFSSDVELFDALIGFVAANRRCTERFLAAIRVHTERIKGNVSVLATCVKQAYAEWSGPAYRAVNGYPSSAAIQISALWITCSGDDVLIRTDEITSEIQAYSQAGIIEMNLELNTKLCRIHPPDGCLLKLLHDICRNAVLFASGSHS
jgi:hypothetical protein